MYNKIESQYCDVKFRKRFNNNMTNGEEFQPNPFIKINT